MRRIYEEKLNIWFNSTNRKPLIVWGARQVGKTYLLKEVWAKNTFDKYVYIDLKRDEKAREYFSTTCEPEKYIKYIEDMSEYNISNEMILKARRIYKNVFSELNKENNKNFKIGNIDKGKSNSIFRLYLSDAGLFNYQGNVKQTDFFVKSRQNVLSGIFFENYVANEFVAKGIPLFFWKGKSDSEFEFLLEKDGKICPVDVKKNKGKLGSLDSYRKINNDATAIKISTNNYGYNKDRNILTIPLYEVYLLAK